MSRQQHHHQQQQKKQQSTSSNKSWISKYFVPQRLWSRHHLQHRNTFLTESSLASHAASAVPFHAEAASTMGGSIESMRELWNAQNDDLRTLDMKYTEQVYGSMGDGKEVADKTLYELLRVEPDASQQVIRRSYMKQSLLHHPDAAHRIFMDMDRRDDDDDDDAEDVDVSWSDENENDEEKEEERAKERKRRKLARMRRQMPLIRSIPNPRLESFFDQRQSELNNAKETLLDPQSRALYNLFGKEGRTFQGRQQRNAASAQPMKNDDSESTVDDMEMARMKFIRQYNESPVMNSQSCTAKLDLKKAMQYRNQAQQTIDEAIRRIEKAKAKITRRRELLEAELKTRQDRLETMTFQMENPGQRQTDEPEVVEAPNEGMLVEEQESLGRLQKTMHKITEADQKIQNIESKILQKKDEAVQSRRLQLASAMQNFTSNQSGNVVLGPRTILGANFQVQPAQTACGSTVFALIHPFTDQSTGEPDTSSSFMSQLYHLNNVGHGLSKLFWINRANIAISPKDHCYVQLNSELMGSNRNAYTTDWSLGPDKLSMEWSRTMSDKWTVTTTTELSTDLAQEGEIIEARLKPETTFRLENRLSDIYSQNFETELSDGKVELSYELKKKLDSKHALSAVAECECDLSKLELEYGDSSLHVSDFKLGVQFSKKMPGMLSQILYGQYTPPTNNGSSSSSSSSGGGTSLVVPPAQKLSIGCSLSMRDGIVLDCAYTRGNSKLSLPIVLSDRAFDWKLLMALTAVPYIGYHLVYKPIRTIYQRRQLLAKRKSNFEKSEDARAHVVTFLSHPEIESKWRGIVDFEERRGGLLITNARYGNLQEVEEQERLQRRASSKGDEDVGDEDVRDEERNVGTRSSKAILFNYPDYHPPVMDVTMQLQLMVHNSVLNIPECTLDEQTAELGKWWQLRDRGFHDPAPGENKQLQVIYTFRGQIHKVTVDDFDALRIPLEEHSQSD